MTRTSSLFPNLHDPKPKAADDPPDKPTPELHMPFAELGEGASVPAVPAATVAWSPFAEALSEAGYDPDADFEDDLDGGFKGKVIVQYDDD